MRKKHVPMRTCIACREARPKKELLRVVKTPDNQIRADRTGKLSGRGAYICPAQVCLEKASNGRQLDRALGYKISPEIFAELHDVINEKV